MSILCIDYRHEECELEWCSCECHVEEDEFLT
jgi:hypothetical protein